MKLRNVFLAFTMLTATPAATSEAELGTKDNPRIVGEGVTIVPGVKPVRNNQHADVVLPETGPTITFRADVTDTAKPTKSFGKAFMASLPNVNCQDINASRTELERIENTLCAHTKPDQMTLYKLIDQLNDDGLTSSSDFSNFKNAYTRFLNDYGKNISASDRIERARAVVGSLYALTSSPRSSTGVHWKERIDRWMDNLNDIQYPQVSTYEEPQAVFIDNSRTVVDAVYFDLQSMARSQGYVDLQRSIYRAGLYDRLDNLRVESFLDIIKSGHYDNDFQAKLNLSVCAGYAMLDLTSNLRLDGGFAQRSFNTVDTMLDITQGKAPQTNCESVLKIFR